METPALFTDESAAGLTPEDAEVLERLPAALRGECRVLVAWWRAHGFVFAAYVKEARAMLRERGRGLAPLHVANSLRHPLRGRVPVEIGNVFAVLCARVAAATVPELRHAFSLRDAGAADALLNAGWRCGASAGETPALFPDP